MSSDEMQGSWFDRLKRSIDWSIDQMEAPREERRDHSKQLAGNHYAAYGTDKSVPLPLIKLAVSIYVRTLAARVPHPMIGSANVFLKPTASMLSKSVKKLVEEVDYGETLRTCVLEALFAYGICRVGLVDSGEKVADEPYGVPFVEPLTADDYFVDMTAKTRASIQYEGHDYYLTKEQMDAAGFDYDPQEIQLDQYGTVNEKGQQRNESISISDDQQPYEKRYHIRDVFLHDENKLVTYNTRSGNLLSKKQWTGPRNGPYYVLGFDKVPGNLLPLPPVAVWRDLHDLANVIFRKIGRGAERYKRVLAFQGERPEEIAEFKQAGDGEGIKYTGQRPEPLEAGGFDPKNLALTLQIKELSSYFAGNLDALGGLSPQSETLGQDRLLTESASSQLRDMQQAVADFTRKIYRALMMYEWQDPVRERNIEVGLPGMEEINIMDTFGPEQKTDVEYDEFDMEIDIYSTLDDSPTLKLQRLGYILQQYVFPLLPEIQATGGSLNVQAILDDVAKFSDMREVKQYVNFNQVEPRPEAAQPNAPAPPMQGGGDRRTKVTPSGQADAMSRVLLGEQLQSAEAARAM
jgi:hypothetical protein